MLRPQSSSRDPSPISRPGWPAELLVRAAGTATRGGVLLAVGDLERMAAPARGDGVRVVHREPRRLDRVDVVDLGAREVRSAERIDHDGDAVLLEGHVAF